MFSGTKKFLALTLSIGNSTKFRNHNSKLNHSNSPELLDHRTQMEFNENLNTACKNHTYHKKCLKFLKKPNFSACKHSEFFNFLYALYAIFGALFDETIKFYVCGIL